MPVIEVSFHRVQERTAECPVTFSVQRDVNAMGLEQCRLSAFDVLLATS